MSLKRKRGIEEIIDSRVVTFVIGKGDSKREFRVHEGALVHLSKPLRSLITGGMKESLEGKIIWDDVEPTTFLLLLDYAYTGSYPISYPEYIYNDKSGSEEEEDARKDDAYPASLRRWVKRTSSKRDNKRFAVLEFCQEHFSKYGVETYMGHSLRKEESEGLDSKIIVALDHLLKPSELYILADRYLIDDLKELCINDVGRKLWNAVGDDTLIGHVCSVLRFLHAQTLPEDELRELLLRYLVGDMEYAMKAGVRDLIRDFADYAVELLLEIPSTYWKELQGQVPGALDA
ncbi:hypothetical protein CTAM01_11271 [Colletotrichum tamarilloi]|uniref:BTB domain-containing protein n=1 Tax=Colletotrichum tamarilloi TaxID=1209934 RepID=A0ABQ9QYB9_9PEZI|nr:uncharacterized protein CTAM01_11271 [Colletotrichum tamarilloi]KAK1489122.1 hypothetical protein CTAM01_11271 [Colletotrichum tamarilloi]